MSSISISGDAETADRIQMAVWSPASHALAIVVKNDLYYIQDVSKREEAKRLSVSGEQELVFNGIADWLYEGNLIDFFNYINASTL